MVELPPVVSPIATNRPQPAAGFRRTFLYGFASAGLLCGVFLLGIFLGRGKPNNLPPELLHASASHGTSTMAIATGQIDQDSEGIFFLDYLTGDLQCWVYYPQMGTFGAKFKANVRAQLPSGKNSEYLLVTGTAVTTGTSSNTRPGLCLVYVVDVNEGVFAAYTVPWNRSVENAGSPQGGALVPVSGGQIRAPIPVRK